MRKKWFMIISIIVLIALAVIIYIFLKPNEKNIINSDTNNSCQIDSDCVVQQTSCCPCSMAGEEECMSKENAQKQQIELLKCEKNRACLAMYACRNIECKCKNNKCVE